MRHVLVGLVGACAVVGVGLCVMAARQVATIRPNCLMQGVPLGGLTREEAQRKVRIWWESEKLKPLDLRVAVAGKAEPATLPARGPGKLGVTVDDVATVAQLPTGDWKVDLANAVHLEPEQLAVLPLLKLNPAHPAELNTEVDAVEPPPRKAKVFYDRGQIVIQHETSSMQIDWTGMTKAVSDAILNSSPVQIPVVASPKSVPDKDLDSISDVVSQFSTHFPSSNHPRCSNIRLASSKLNGILLLPGEKLSFNGTVGRRTLKSGFKLAGIYKNGKHDVGIGGGICQVSTTLYNASLFANLRIRQRSNHSLPVAYVPLGRDATVDYGALDLVIQNPYDTPIAVASHYVPGRLTFLILGKKDPSLKVKIEQGPVEIWDEEVSTIVDRSLKPGARRILEPGARRRAVSAFRLVYKDGKLVRRERLGRCTYGGQTRVVAVNPLPQAPKPISPIAPVPQSAPGVNTGLRG